jgi:DnaK suppressor protein
MTKDEKNIINIELKKQIDIIGQQISRLQEKAKPVTPDCSLGRLTRMEAMSEQEVSRRILDETLLRQTRLRNALSRIDSEMFGLCIECEEEIGFERMKIRPESVLCIECANSK